MTAVLTSPLAAPLSINTSNAGHWLEVVSHLDPRYGGLSSAVPAMSRALGDTGFNISVAAFCAPTENFQPDCLDAAQLSFWPASRRSWLLQPSLRRAFQQQLSDCDGVHIHGLWEQSTAAAASAARAENIPYVLSAHGMLEPWALQAKRLKKQMYASLIERRNVSGAACLRALTLAEAEHYVRFGARSPIAVIPNAVSVPAEADPNLFFDRFPALRGRRLILFAARLHPKKGLNLLIEAWASVASRWPDAHLVIAGADFEGTRARIEAQTDLLGLRSSILFTGMLDSASKWSALAASEAFVLPSHSEGLSMGVLEAMGMGLPVIVTEPCNMPEVPESGAGWQIQPDTAELTAALTELFDNASSKNAQIGSRGAQLVRARFSPSVVTGHMAELYSWVQGGPRPTSIDLIHP